MTWLPAVLAGYAMMSAVTFGVYGWDKRRARYGGSRIRESTLHTLEMLGGWPGAFLAQRLVRHKNAKPGYQVVFWLIGAAHGMAWIAVCAGVG